MNIDELLQNPPKFHTDSSGNPVSWQLDEKVLLFIKHMITDQSKTLETGAGISTVVFAIERSHHTCIVPDANQIRKIISYCNRNAIETTKLSFEEGCSENVLPRLRERELDLALIDGRHAFPSPFIDWYYIAMMLKVGGIMIIDDTHLWTGDVMKSFLTLEPEWKLLISFPRSAAFTKVSEGSHEKDWIHQPFLAKRSSLGIRKEQFRFALDQLRKGHLSTLISHIKTRK